MLNRNKMSLRLSQICVQYVLVTLVSPIGGLTASNTSNTEPPSSPQPSPSPRPEPPFWWDASDYPDPRWDLAECRVSKKSYICDPSKTMSDTQIASLNNWAKIIREKPSPCCENIRRRTNHTMMIAIVPRIRRQSGTVYSDWQVLRTFADSLRTRVWSVQEKICYMQFYIALELNTKQAWVSMNDDVGRVMEDEEVYQTIRDAQTKYFIKGRVYDGLISIMTTYSKRIDDFNANINSKCLAGVGKILGILFGTIIGVIAIIVLFCYCFDKHC